MISLKSHLNSVSERFDEKFEGFYDLIPTEDNGYTSSEITHYEELKSFLLQENKRVIELVVEYLNSEIEKLKPYSHDGNGNNLYFIPAAKIKILQDVISELTSAIDDRIWVVSEVGDDSSDFIKTVEQ